MLLNEVDTSLKSDEEYDYIFISFKFFLILSLFLNLKFFKRLVGF